MNNHRLIKRKSTAIVSGVGVQTPIFVKEAYGAELWDVEGHRYIDFASGIAVVNTGHRHPKVVAAIQEQLGKFTHTCHQVVPYENYVALGERLNAAVNTGEENRTLFVTTGAEAVENAVKIARAATQRHGVIAFHGGFHGRTFMAMALTGKVAPYGAQFGPMISGVYHAPYPYKAHGVSVEDAMNGIMNLFKADISPTDVAAIILEPIQGEGGFIPAPAEFLRDIRSLCDEYGIVLIADEVQTGFARTGKLFAMDHYDVHADLITMAKGLAGGVPLAAVTGKARLMDKVAAGGLGGTYGGNPLAIAAALAVLDIIEEESLCARASTLGLQLKEKLRDLRNHTPHIADIRGLGLMVAAEFIDPKTGKADAAFAKKVQQEAFSRKLILLTCGIYGNVIRFLSPLSIANDVFTEALDILEASVNAAKEG